MVIFTEIPKEVLFDHLFPYLHLNDLLRLRRVCKWTKPLAEDYLALHVTTSRWISLWLKPKYDESFWKFLDLSLIVPVSRICIENKDDKDPKIWDVDVTPRFVKLYGERITHFQLNRLELPLSTEAIEFFESLTNLKHLTIGTVSISTVGTGSVDLPSTFRKLKELVIESYRCETGQVQLYRSFLEGCSSCLEFAKHGLRLKGISEELFQTLLDIMINRRNPALKVEYDLVGTDGKRDDVLMIRRFYRLVTACDQNLGTLRNVDAELIEGMMGRRNVFEEPERKLSNVIVSMSSLRRSCFGLELNNLEEIETRDGTSYCTMPEDNYDRMEWPKLKKLFIYVDGARMREWNEDGDPVLPVSRLLSHFFVDARHEKMESLDLIVETFERISFPRTRNLWESCPNLKRLSLNAWPRTNADLSKLWNHLPCLEELIFENCPKLGNVAFVGENVEQPTFFNLKKLRKLQLTDVNRMPKITDTLFTLVLRHMPLKKFIMGHEFDADDDLDIKSFTVAGIKSLLTGVFAETIEKFPLHHLGIKGVSEGEMMALEKEFRSARML